MAIFRASALAVVLLGVSSSEARAHPPAARNSSDSAAAQCSYSHSGGVHKIELDGRYFLLVVPEGLEANKRNPIVIDVPGYSESPYYQLKLTNIQQSLNVFKWIGAIPFGTAPTPTITCCPKSASVEDCEAGKTLDKSNACSFNAGGCCGTAASKRTSDVEFIRKISEWIEQNMCGDKSVVFATGFSNGGMMSNRLGCEAADLFTMVAPVAGNVRLGGDFVDCKPSRPVGWVSICGDEDSACNRDFETTAAQWAARNGCTGTERDLEPTYNTETTMCYMYKGCRARTEFCTIFGLKHEWSGHPRPDGTSPARPRTDVDATAFIFERFAATIEQQKNRMTNVSSTHATLS